MHPTFRLFESAQHPREFADPCQSQPNLQLVFPFKLFDYCRNYIKNQRALDGHSPLRCHFLIFFAVHFFVSNQSDHVIGEFTNQRDEENKAKRAPICDGRADLDRWEELTASHEQEVKVEKKFELLEEDLLIFVRLV